MEVSKLYLVWILMYEFEMMFSLFHVPIIYDISRPQFKPFSRSNKSKYEERNIKNYWDEKS